MSLAISTVSVLVARSMDFVVLLFDLDRDLLRA
jgi:hypothetical protein